MDVTAIPPPVLEDVHTMLFIPEKLAGPCLILGKAVSLREQPLHEVALVDKTCPRKHQEIFFSLFLMPQCRNRSFLRGFSQARLQKQKQSTSISPAYSWWIHWMYSLVQAAVLQDEVSAYEKLHEAMKAHWILQSPPLPLRYKRPPGSAFEAKRHGYIDRHQELCDVGSACQMEGLRDRSWSQPFTDFLRFLALFLWNILKLTPKEPVMTCSPTPRCFKSTNPGYECCGPIGKRSQSRTSTSLEG